MADTSLTDTTSELMPWLRPSTMPPAARVALLLAEKDEYGRVLEFVEASPRGVVHVVGPDEDQPQRGDVADRLLFNRFRTVCGQNLSMSAGERGLLSTFRDERICLPCLRAFGEHSHHIFADNTEHSWASGLVVNADIRRNKLAEGNQE